MRTASPPPVQTPTSDLGLANLSPTLDNPAFRGIMRQASQMLRQPENYDAGVRRGVAFSLLAALKPYADDVAAELEAVPPPYTDADAPPEAEYEPGCELEEVEN